jgi:transmembrane sensor
VERLVKVARRQVRRMTVGRIAVAGAAFVVVVLAILGMRTQPTRLVISTKSGASTASVAVPPPPPSSRPGSATLRLDDGTSATPLEPGSTLGVVEESPRRFAIELSRGRARFEAMPAWGRSFSVRAREVTVVVASTVFTVERVGDRVGVGVERGRALVDWGLGARELGAGDSGWFPPFVVGPAAASGVVSRAMGSDARSQSSWRQSRQVDKVTPAEVEPRETAEALLAAADAARLHGRADEGAELLRRLLKEHRADPRAPLAAFTLGRVLLFELGQPRQAAAAFAEVRALEPGGPFAEDALAREVEARRLAGASDQAKGRAREYLRLHRSRRRSGP